MRRCGMRARWWAAALIPALLVLPACEGDEPRGAYGGQAPPKQLEEPGRQVTGRATLEGTVEALDRGAGRITLAVAPAGAKGQGEAVRDAGMRNPAESAQLAGRSLVVRGTPHQLQGLSEGQRVSLPTVQYQSDVWLAPGWHREKKVEGALTPKAGNGRKIAHGRVHSLQSEKGLLVLERQGGQTLTVHAHPNDLLGLQTDGFVNVLYEEVDGTAWALGVHATMEAGEQAWPGSEGGQPVDGGVSDLPKQASPTAPTDGGGQPVGKDGG